MATERFPNRNVNIPMDPKAVEAARERANPGYPGLRSVGTPAQAPAPADNKYGSKRVVRPGEWIDDRSLKLGGPASPSKDSPPPLVKQGQVPSSYDAHKVYDIKLFKSVSYAGRNLSPAFNYKMAGHVAEKISASILSAVEVDSGPVAADAPPSKG